MGRFLSVERRRQAAFKAESASFSEAARKDRVYRGKPRAFCLPRDCARASLFPEIRDAAPGYGRPTGTRFSPRNPFCTRECSKAQSRKGQDALHGV